MSLAVSPSTDNTVSKEALFLDCFIFDDNNKKQVDGDDLFASAIPHYEQSVRLFDKESDVPNRFFEKSEEYVGRRMAAASLMGETIKLPKDFLKEEILDLNGKPAEEVVKKFLLDCKLHDEADKTNLQQHFAVLLPNGKVKVTFWALDQNTLEQHQAVRDPKIIANAKAKSGGPNNQGAGHANNSLGSAHEAEVRAAVVLNAINASRGFPMSRADIGKAIIVCGEKIRLEQAKNNSLKISLNPTDSQPQALPGAKATTDYLTLSQNKLQIFPAQDISALVPVLKILIDLSGESAPIPGQDDFTRQVRALSEKQDAERQKKMADESIRLEQERLALVQQQPKSRAITDPVGELLLDIKSKPIFQAASLLPQMHLTPPFQSTGNGH